MSTPVRKGQTAEAQRAPVEAAAQGRPARRVAPVPSACESDERVMGGAQEVIRPAPCVTPCVGIGPTKGTLRATSDIGAGETAGASVARAPPRDPAQTTTGERAMGVKEAEADAPCAARGSSEAVVGCEGGVRPPARPERVGITRLPIGRAGVRRVEERSLGRDGRRRTPGVSSVIVEPVRIASTFCGAPAVRKRTVGVLMDALLGAARPANSLLF